MLPAEQKSYGKFPQATLILAEARNVSSESIVDPLTAEMVELKTLDKKKKSPVNQPVALNRPPTNQVQLRRVQLNLLLIRFHFVRELMVRIKLDINCQRFPILLIREDSRTLT